MNLESIFSVRTKKLGNNLLIYILFIVSYIHLLNINSFMLKLDLQSYIQLFV